MLRLHLCNCWTQALSHSLQGFSNSSMHMAVMAPFLHSIIQIDEAIASTTCVEAKKEACHRNFGPAGKFPRVFGPADHIFQFNCQIKRSVPR